MCMQDGELLSIIQEHLRSKGLHLTAETLNSEATLKLQSSQTPNKPATADWPARTDAFTSIQKLGANGTNTR